jgi:hypothetical protein
VKKHQLKNGGKLELATAHASTRPDSLYDRRVMRFARRDGKTSY